MEVDTITEMFKLSEENYRNKNYRYKNYIDDGDSKTYSGIINSVPYSNTAVIKKECIDYVLKRMRSKLQEFKRKNEGLDGKKLINR